MTHAVLLGDSILDNAAYVRGGSPVKEQLRMRLPSEWNVTLLAQDGAASVDVLRQLKQLPDDATHLIISAGGNDALESMPILNAQRIEPSQLLAELTVVQNEFRINYRNLVRAACQRTHNVVGCTIYDAVPGLAEHERMALSLFNDMIIRELANARLPVLDLRVVCREAEDYSSVSPIEPSEIGGSKIARGLQVILLSHDFSRRETILYP